MGLFVLDQEAGGFALGMQGIGGNHPSGEIQGFEEGFDLWDLVGTRPEISRCAMVMPCSWRKALSKCTWVPSGRRAPRSALPSTATASSGLVTPSNQSLRVALTAGASQVCGIM